MWKGLWLSYVILSLKCSCECTSWYNLSSNSRKAAVTHRDSALIQFLSVREQTDPASDGSWKIFKIGLDIVNCGGLSVDWCLFANPGRVKSSDLEPELGTVREGALAHTRVSHSGTQSRMDFSSVTAAACSSHWPPVSKYRSRNAPARFGNTLHQSLFEWANSLLTLDRWENPVISRHVCQSKWLCTQGKKNNKIKKYHKPINSLLQDDRPSVHLTILLSAA